jgi:hypothetical protein
MSNTTTDHQDAKAEAKAAKAYAKATRPFYKKKRYWALAGVATVVLIQVANGGGSESTTGDEAATTSDKPAASANQKPAENKAPAKPKAIAVQAVDILAEFEANEAAADAKYKGKTIRVTGFVDKVDTEIFDSNEYVVQIGGGTDFEFFTVNADDQKSEDVVDLKKGDKITVEGEFEDGGDLGVEMKHADIVG